MRVLLEHKRILLVQFLFESKILLNMSIVDRCFFWVNMLSNILRAISHWRSSFAWSIFILGNRIHESVLRFKSFYLVSSQLLRRPSSVLWVVLRLRVFVLLRKLRYNFNWLLVIRRIHNTNFLRSIRLLFIKLWHFIWTILIWIHWVLSCLLPSLLLLFEKFQVFHCCRVHIMTAISLWHVHRR